MTKTKKFACANNSTTGKLPTLDYVLAIESSLTDYQFLTLLAKGGGL